MSAVLATVLIGVFGALGAAKLAAVPAMRAAAGHLGFSARQYRAVGALELAGAAGVAIGLVTPLAGILAGVGLTLLMLGAARAHHANHDGPVRVGIPLAVAAVAVAAYGRAMTSAASGAAWAGLPPRGAGSDRM